MPKNTFADILIIIVVTLLIGSASVFAQHSSVAITPASIDTTVKAGSSYTQDFTLTNKTGVRLRFHASAADIWFDEQNQRINAKAGTQPRSASTWIQFMPVEVIVEANSSAVIKAVISVPQAATGSFYTVPVFEVAPADRPVVLNAALNTTATASIGIRFRALMILTTEQGAEYNVEIMSGSVTPPTASSELHVSMDLRNRGTANAKMRGAYAIIDSDGKLAGRGTTEEKRFMPTQRNLIKGSWAGELKPGDYTAVITLSHNRVGGDPTSMMHEIPFTVK